METNTLDKSGIQIPEEDQYVLEYVLEQTTELELEQAGIDREGYKLFLQRFFTLPHVVQGTLAEKYAKKPETFPGDSFYIKPMIADGSQLNMRYMAASGSPIDAWPHSAMNVDAPFIYSLAYRVNNVTWEQISIVSFRVDFKRGLLLIDQLQGGTTDDYSPATSKGRRARNKFKSSRLSVEEVMYDMVEELSKQLGLRGIALLKAKHNAWIEVRESDRETIYERVAKDKGHIILDQAAHSFKKV